MQRHDFFHHFNYPWLGHFLVNIPTFDQTQVLFYLLPEVWSIFGQFFHI
jgi:hypothetical protein